MGILSSVVYHYVYYYDGILGKSGDVLQSAGLAAVVVALFIPLGKSRDLYNPAELLNLKSQIRKVSIKWLAVLLFLAAVAFTMKAGGNFSRGTTILFAIFGLVALIIERAVWRVVLADGLAVRRFSGRKIVLIVEQGADSKSGIFGGSCSAWTATSASICFARRPKRCSRTKTGHCQSDILSTRFKYRRNYCGSQS